MVEKGIYFGWVHNDENIEMTNKKITIYVYQIIFFKKIYKCMVKFVIMINKEKSLITNMILKVNSKY